MGSNAPITSLRSSPAASQQILTNTAVVTPEGSLTPQGLQALLDSFVPITQAFRNASSEQQVPNDTTTMSPGGSDQFRISSVGLGYELESSHNLQAKLSNTSSAAITVTVSPFFPLDTLANTVIQLNGGATVYSASGIAGFKVAVRRYRGILTAILSGHRGPFFNYTSTYTTTAPTIKSTPNGVFSFSGIDTISIPANSTVTLNCDFQTREPIAKDEVSLIGALMLQNNQTYATCQRQMIGALVGTTQKFPFQVASADLVDITVSGPSKTNQPQLTTETTYDFWALPSDPTLYSDMVATSYYVTEQPSNAIPNTGSQAVSYNLPQNMILMQMHFGFMDGNGDYMYPLSNPNEDNKPDIPRWQLMYNAGVIIPVTRFARRERLRQLLLYGGDIGKVPGYLLWDGSATGPDVNNTDEAGFLDTYFAANPQAKADVASTVVVSSSSGTAEYSVTREYLVTSNVQVLGGAG